MVRFPHKKCARFDKGFTLIELLVALAVAGIVSTALFTTFFSQNKVYIEQEQVVAMQQNLRAGFDLMLREMRLAGYVGDGFVEAGFEAAEADRIEFTLNLNAREDNPANEDDDLDDDGEYLTYELFDSGGIPCLGRRTTDGGAIQAVAENIVGLGFAYAFVENVDDENLAADAGGRIYWAIVGANGNWHDLDANGDGQVTAADDTDNNGVVNAVDTGIVADLANIRAVQVWVLARTGVEARGFVDSRRYAVGSQVIQPSAGYVISGTGVNVPANTGFRYRLLNAMVNSRNLGL
ncbi:MAG: prepilin-type N-terminal cleavage/methylation domain-containing protein [Desulfuromonadales bacterium]|nr:prepilin-type N-terminal cleavage/methylation domain-containing protein [Desulfuromonadales bacterium]MDW7756840.1 prepilin-type N-terminal cleavage/methylation domain-containing protein [Desulfuromonadales bacterium]